MMTKAKQVTFWSFGTATLGSMLTFAAALLLAGCGGDTKTAAVAPELAVLPQKPAVALSKSSASQSIFANQTPVITDLSDGVSYELGLKFQATVDGRITAIRYWKAPSETPSPCPGCERVTHTGKIWAEDSSVPTTLTFRGFADETASGWQEAQLATPLNIQKNVTYIVSVETNSHYVATNDALVTPLTNNHLIALAGVFGPRGQKPTQTYRNTHYFRDVVFEPHEGQSIFTTQVPSLLDATDTDPACTNCPAKTYELGTRFTAQVDGEILGIRYWRAASETLQGGESNADNVGRIWSAEGTQLASVNFNFQWPRSGWHYAMLATPLAIQSGQTYTVSVPVNSHYAISPNTLSSPVVNGSLSVLVDGGVFGARGTYPTNVWNSSSYFRDVLFKPAIGISVVTNRLPNATLGMPYSTSLTANGGSRPLTWRVFSGELPGGITLTSDGTLSGIPIVIGATTLAFQVTDAENRTAVSSAMTLSVRAPLAITTPPSLPEGRVGQPYVAKLEATGGAGGYTWSFVQGNLISGLSLTLDGQITGTPRVAGTATVTLRVQDRNGATSDAALTVTVLP
jgi:hypothetical protein